MAEAAAEMTPDDLVCPVCDYSLRGLPEPRCPECGYAFEWEELRQRAENRRKWFYEHAETFKSHLKTRWRSLRPWSFWTDIQAYTFANPRRLWRYRLTTFAVIIFASSAFLIPWVAARLGGMLPQTRYVSATTMPAGGAHNVTQIEWDAVGQPQITQFPGRPFKMPPSSGNMIPIGRSVLSQHMPPGHKLYIYYVPPPGWATFLHPYLSRDWTGIPITIVVVTLAMTIVTPLLVHLYWKILRISVLRANVKPVHLARLEVYTMDVLPLLLLFSIVAVLVADGIYFEKRWYWSESLDRILAGCTFAPTIIISVITLRLALALKLYVRFPHAWPVALVFGLIATLTWLIVVLQVVTP